MNHSLYPGVILSNRYRIGRELGHGGFGRTYLAEDTYRFNELCVLKEFAPQVQGSYALEKSQELFEREAGVLYKLQHPQIPRFREMFRVSLNDRGSLFLVQDYVEGQTYRTLLETRKRQGQAFVEGEIVQLLHQILPVLDYIHSLGVIHRDISPDNLMQCQVDGQPVLIDFGGVKEVAATAQSQYGQANGVAVAATRLGKVGYAPEEQMQLGIAFPHSDLYALAATVLVLLTGKEPQQLIDAYSLTWSWRQHGSLSPNVGSVLDKMLAQRPGDRFQSAREVLQALRGEVPTPASIPHLPATQPPPDFTFNPQGVSLTVAAPVTQPPPTGVVKPRGFSKTIAAFLGVLVIVGTGGAGWVAGHYWLARHFPKGNGSHLTGKNPQEALHDRLQRLGINESFYIRLVDEIFYGKYPELGGRSLRETESDREWRNRWHQIADDLLNKLQNLSRESRQRLGQYDTTDIDRWKVAVNQLNLSSQALYDLADSQFFLWFPDQSRNQNLIGLPLGQVWQAITTDKLKAVQEGREFESIQFDRQSVSKTVQGSLKPGEGKAYIARLKKGQTLRLDLDATPQTTLLSIYTPGTTKKSRPLLQDSQEVSWSGKLDDSGYYELVVVSQGTEPLAYQLKVKVQ